MPPTGQPLLSARDNVRGTTLYYLVNSTTITTTHAFHGIFMMIWPLLAASASAVGLNYQASRDLDITTDKKSPAWPLFALGALTGLWFGVSFSGQIKSTFSFIDVWIGLAKPKVIEDSDTSSEDEDTEARKKRKKKASKT